MIGAIPTISKPLRQALAVLLLIALGHGIWSFAVAPTIDAFARFDRAIENNRSILGRYLAVAARRDVLEKRLAEMKRDRAVLSGFLQEAKPELASANLVRRAKTVVTTSGGSVQRIQTLPFRNERFGRASVQVSMQGDIVSIRKILHALETGTPALFVDSLDISNRRGRIRTASRSGASSSPLQVRFTLSGFMKPVTLR